MSETLPIIFAAAGTYVQGAGVLAVAGPHLARLGKRAVGVMDPVVREQVEPALSAGCESEGIAWWPEPFPGECTEAAVDRLVAATRTWNPEMVIAAGGGKAPDTGEECKNCGLLSRRGAAQHAGRAQPRRSDGIRPGARRRGRLPGRIAHAQSAEAGLRRGADRRAGKPPRLMAGR